MRFMLAAVGLVAVVLLALAAAAIAQSPDQPAEKPDYSQYGKDTLVVVAGNMHDEITRLQAEVASLKAQLGSVERERAALKSAAAQAKTASAPTADASNHSSDEAAQFEADRTRWAGEWQTQADKLQAEITALREKASREQDKTKAVQLRKDVAEKERELAAWGKEKKSFIGSIEPALYSRGRIPSYAVSSVIDGRTLTIRETRLPVRFGNSISYIGSRDWIVRGVDTAHVAVNNSSVLDGKLFRVVDIKPHIAGQKLYVLEVVE